MHQTSRTYEREKLGMTLNLHTTPRYETIGTSAFDVSPE